ncbi:hypothetical protein [Sphingobacterium sp. UDSM-2020]|uniref:hypothetical protein n=1 Tax=Sphingobacterium sp. UDSM-2020 TaxID=2795738 RepID=UPI00193915FD|nr:hypothetical protein [Sphingobacterium sp. UDSM-2020]QQD11932.1 hypothetical protein JAZ75_15000 [Sphingobacterium sp. UDSM-2020]
MSYKPDLGIPVYFDEFVKENKQAQFFFYPDNRIDPMYLSSIRPHILKQHFESFPNLKNEIICYHDSDILFRERLNEQVLSETDNWYFSDARNYVSSMYLKRFGNSFFENLCKTVAIDPVVVEKNENHSGGAQHIMKVLTATYWQNVEDDAEKIFTYIKEYNASLSPNSRQVQAWCADMWAVLWNAWKLDIQVRLHDELIFSWPKDHISNFYHCKIFHNSGVFVEDKNDYFCKLSFKNSSPYDVDFSTIKTDHCSIKFVEQIEKIARKQQKKSLKELTIIIAINNIDVNQQNRVVQYINYLYKHLLTEVHVIELGSWPTFNQNLIKDKCKYYYSSTHRTVDKHIKQRVKTKNFIYIDANILLPVENIIKTAEILCAREKSLTFPMNELLEMSIFQFNLFKDTLPKDIDRKKNHQTNDTLDYIECFAMAKKDFIITGGNNNEWHYYTEDGFNLERQIRCRYLGCHIEKVNLNAFKLFTNGKRNDSKKKNSAEKYLQICDRTTDNIKRKIAYADYSYNRPYRKKYDLVNLTIGINGVKANIDISSIQKSLIEEHVAINLVNLKSTIGQTYHENFISVIKKAKKNKLDYLILVSENINFENKENIGIFWKALKDMNYYGLQLLSVINEGGFTREKQLNEHLFWIDTMPESAVFVVHKSLFEKILRHTFETDKSLERNLRVLTDHVGVTSSFIGLPKMPHDLDEKNEMAYSDRLKNIAKVENKLAWISNNRIN